MGGMLRDGCTGGRGLYEGPRVRQPSGRKSARRVVADPRSWSVLGAGAGRAYDRVMNSDLVTRIVVALERASVRYKVIGAVALNAHGIARGTQDLDLFVAPDETNVAALRVALKAVFDGDASLDELTASDLAGEYPAIQYVSPDGSFSIDILARLGDAFAYEALEAMTTTWMGVPMTVVTPRQLFLMKRDTLRPQDQADAARLRRRFGFEEP